MHVRHGGWSLAELLVGLTLVAVVAAAVLGVFVTAQRHSARAAAQAVRESERRAAVLLLSSELRGIDPAGSSGDLIGAWKDSLVYRAPSSLHVACAAPQQLAGGAVRVVLEQRDWGRACFDPVACGALVLWTEGGTDRWHSAQLVNVAATDMPCSSGEPGRAVTLAGLHPPEAPSGALVRTFEVRKLAAYPDRSGQWWLGVQERDPVTYVPRAVIQPALGPVAPRGVSFTYLDVSGKPTVDRDAIARVTVTLVFPEAGVVAGTDTLDLDVALSNRVAW